MNLPVSRDKASGLSGTLNASGAIEAGCVIPLLVEASAAVCPLLLVAMERSV